MASSLRRTLRQHIFGCHAVVVGDCIKSSIHDSNDERNATQQSLTREQEAGNQKLFFIVYPNAR